MTRSFVPAPLCFVALVLGCTWFQPPQPPEPPRCDCPIGPQPLPPPPPPPSPSMLRVYDGSRFPLGLAYSTTPEQVIIQELQSDGVPRLVARSVNDGFGAVRLPDFQYQTTDCTGQRWVSGRLSPSFAYPQPVTGEVLASPGDAGYGFVPSATFLSTSSALSDGGIACTRYEPLPYTTSATRLETVGIDQPPTPPLLIAP